MTRLGFHEGRRASLRMRQERRAAGLTLQGLADRLGVSESWVGHRERGSVRLTAEAEQRIAGAFGLASLLGDSAP